MDIFHDEKKIIPIILVIQFSSILSSTTFQTQHCKDEHRLSIVDYHRSWVDLHWPTGINYPRGCILTFGRMSLENG